MTYLYHKKNGTFVWIYTWFTKQILTDGQVCQMKDDQFNYRAMLKRYHVIGKNVLIKQELYLLKYISPELLLTST